MGLALSVYLVVGSRRNKLHQCYCRLLSVPSIPWLPRLLLPYIYTNSSRYCWQIDRATCSNFFIIAYDCETITSLIYLSNIQECVSLQQVILCVVSFTQPTASPEDEAFNHPPTTTASCRCFSWQLALTPLSTNFIHLIKSSHSTALNNSSCPQTHSSSHQKIPSAP